MAVAIGVAPTELKSVGSLRHPHNCEECHFYFFGPTGCTRGDRCRFSHTLPE